MILVKVLVSDKNTVGLGLKSLVLQFKSNIN